MKCEVCGATWQGAHVCPVANMLTLNDLIERLTEIRDSSRGKEFSYGPMPVALRIRGKRKSKTFPLEAAYGSSLTIQLTDTKSIKVIELVSNERNEIKKEKTK